MNPKLILYLFLVVVVPLHVADAGAKSFCRIMYVTELGNDETTGNELLRSMKLFERHWEAHDYLEALKETHRAKGFAVNQKGITLNLQGELFVRYGSVLQKLGDYERAERALKKGIDMLREVCTLNSPLLGKGLNAIATVYLATGRLSQARRFYDYALVGLGSPQYSVPVLNNRAHAEILLGMYDDAEETLTEAETRLSEYRGAEVLLASVRTSQAGLYFHTGRIYDALSALSGVVEIWSRAAGPRHPNVAQALNNRGEIFRVLGRSADARQDLETGLQIVADGGAVQPAVTLSLLNNLAKLELEQDRAEAALVHLDRAMGLLAKKHIQTHQMLSVRHLRATALLRIGGSGEAETELRTVLEERRALLGSHHPAVLESLHSLTRLYATRLRSQSREEALRRSKQYSDEAMEVLAFLSGPGAATVSSKLEFSELRRNFRAVFEGRLQLLWELAQIDSSGQRKSDAESFAVAQSMRRMGAAASMAALRLRYHGALSTESRDQVASFARLVHERAQLLEDIRSLSVGEINASGRRSLQLKRRRLGQVHAELKELRNSVKSDHILDAFRSGAILDASSAGKLLRDDQALLAIAVLEGRSFGWIVNSRGELRRFAISAGTKRLQTLVTRLRSSLNEASFNQARFNHAPAHELYTLLLGPVAKHLLGIKHIYLVKDGPLSAIPFSLLLEKPSNPLQSFDDMQQLAWLVRRYAFTTLSAIADLAGVSGGHGREAGKSLAVVAPEDSVTAPVQFESLAPYGRQVLAQLALMPSAITTVSSRAATEQRIKQMSQNGELARYKQVAFFAHGFMPGDTPEVVEPGLRLGRNASEDGLLLASEIARLEMNAEWVVLAACNTAAVSERWPQALDALARAFFDAGTRAIAVSHWRTRADVGVELMRTLFGEDLSAEDPARRLQALQQRYIAHPDNPAFAHPFIWAPMTVVGQTR